MRKQQTRDLIASCTFIATAQLSCFLHFMLTFFQLQAGFMHMTRVNMVECIQRMEIAIARLQLDKVAGDIVTAAQQTNIVG